GFLHDGELVITGRLKDMMIVRGRNIYPQDVEQTIDEIIPFVRPNTCAVFAINEDDQEAIAAVVQADRAFARTLAAAAEAHHAPERAAVDQVINSMCQAVAEQFEVTLKMIAFVKPGTLPRTSSGKVQRAACRAGLSSGELAVLRLWNATSAPAPDPHPAAGMDRSRAVTLELIHAVVAQFLREQLGQVVERVNLETPFAALGIDSIGGVRVLREIEDVIGCHLSPQAIYDFPSIRELAAYIDSPAVARREPGARQSTHTQPRSAGSRASASSFAAPIPDRSQLVARYVVRSHRIEKLRAAGHYFYGTPVSEQSGSRVVAQGRDMLMLGSYSYLGLVRHADIEAAARAAIERFGTGHHGVRVLAGTTVMHRELEERLASLLLAEDSIVYSSGFTTNVATITALVGEGDCVIGDAWNHASIVDGCRFSGAEFLVYGHADMVDLERQLRDARGRHTLVVVDSVFSMDGDIAQLPSIVELCRRYGALLMVDEAHSLGVLGATGRGIQEHFGLPHDAVDVKMATLSKAIPSAGGVVAGRRTIVDYLRHNARGYVFSGALPTANAAAALAALDVIEREPERLKNLWRNVERYVGGLRLLGFDIAGTTTPIVPILCPDEHKTMEMTRLCRADGVFVVPVTYPAVPMNAPRLRTCVSAAHTDADIQLALDVLARAGRNAGLLR
ncbi:MAG: aminotransferase class I/II-fold pyridoxal phosphate-dependent enzyme, partial [Polyangiaceae bacterium]